MIPVTRLNGSELYVNSDLVETVEATPDTVVTLTTGRKLVVLESVDDVVERMVQFRRRIATALQAPSESAGHIAGGDPSRRENRCG